MQVFLYLFNAKTKYDPSIIQHFVHSNDLSNSQRLIKYLPLRGALLKFKLTSLQCSMITTLTSKTRSSHI